ncbi:MAG: ADP-ribosylation factor-like protein [Candidatus Hermodarchaeota archaeon]
MYRGNELLYYRHFGKAIKQEALDLLVEDIIDEALIRTESKINYHDYYKFRVSYITEKEANLLFLFVTGLTDKFENIEKELVKCKNEFLSLFEDILQHHVDAKTFEVFDPTVDSIHKNLRPKISLVGFSGVGKTTITKLIKADEIPMRHIPTITGDIATIKIGKLHFHLWDFAGQEQFSYLWNNFIKGSDAVLLITDSTLENVEKSKYFLEIIKEQAPHAQSAAIGNKQDLKGALNAVQIEHILGLKAYSMIALDPNNRDKMIQIIADILEMSAEVSPLLKPLLERDKFTEEALKALKNADFNKATFLFDKISDLCIELGDDSLGREFFEKSQKIKDMLKKVGAPPPVPVTSVENEFQKSHEITEAQEKIEQITIQKQALTPAPPPPKLPPEQISPQPQDPLKIKKPFKISSSRVELLDTKSDIKEVVTPINSEVKKPVLKLNPQDFMIRTRPKSVKVVPNDVKSKLKMSSDSPIGRKEEFKAPVPVAPLKLMEEKAKSSKNQPETSISPKLPIKQVSQENSPITSEIKKDVSASEIKRESISSESLKKLKIVSPQQREKLNQSLIELKIKKTNLTKMTLDFDMQELTGKITSAELEDKKSKIKIMMDKIDDQIHEIENMLDD